MKPLKRDFRLIINEKLAELGLDGTHRVVKDYKNLLFYHQLERFQIADIDWFKGAADLLNLVDQLHTQMTTVEELHQLAEMLNIEVPESIGKEELAQLVKSHPDWKVKAFELDLQSRLD